jgi:hypothetical protein
MERERGPIPGIITPQKYGTYARISSALWQDTPSRDWLLHRMTKNMHDGLAKHGLRPFGPVIYRYRVMSPDEVYYDPDIMYVFMWQRGVPVVPVHPTEWDTCL